MEDVLNPQMKKIILDQTTEEKIKMLENAYDDGFWVFWGIANVLLEAPCGEGGGLPTEVIDGIFQRKLNESK